jgi:hypothetical protein
MAEDVAAGAGVVVAVGAGLAGAAGAGAAAVAGAADIASVEVDFLRFFFLLVVSVDVWPTATVAVATDKPKATKAALAKIFKCFFIFISPTQGQTGCTVVNQTIRAAEKSHSGCLLSLISPSKFYRRKLVTFLKSD